MYHIPTAKLIQIARNWYTLTPLIIAGGHNTIYIADNPQVSTNNLQVMWQ